jgi:hypothetical protein
MTSSQEPPLTRREARERERLRELQAEQATPDAAAPAAPPTPQVSAPTPYPAVQQPSAPYPQQAPTPVPSAPGYAAAPAAAPVPRPAQAPQPSPAPRASAPERTLTRRELRAMLESHSGDGFDEFELDDEEFLPEPRSAASAGASQAPIAPGQPPQHHALDHPAPVRAPAPHTTVDTGLDDLVTTPKPVGHWTSQLNLPEERPEPFDQLLSRGAGVSGMPTTTNALILPSLPDHGSIGGTPLAPSGEIIVTGSIDLPRSYGATGVHPSQIDSTDVDRLFDQIEDSGTGVAPVAATRAISTQGATRSMLAPPTKEGMNVPLVLAVTAGVLALGVVGTLVIGALTGLFS